MYYVVNYLVPRVCIEKEYAHVITQASLCQSSCITIHSLIRGVLIQSCPAGAKFFTNYVFCHVQFSGVIQNHYSYDESITVYKLGHLFPNYNVLIGNFDNYCSNLIVSDD